MIKNLLPRLLCSPHGQPETAITTLFVGRAPSFFLFCARTLKMFASLPLQSLPKPEAAPSPLHAKSGVQVCSIPYLGSLHTRVRILVSTHIHTIAHTHATNTCASE